MFVFVPLILFLSQTHALSCAICVETLNILTPFLQSNTTRAVIASIATEICIEQEKNSGWPDCNIKTCPTLCSDLIKEETVDVITILTELDIKPERTCFYLLLETPNDCPVPNENPNPTSYIPIKTNLFNTTGEIGPMKWPFIWNQTTGMGNFIHLSDLHVDLSYAANTNTACGYPLCCRAEFGNGSSGPWGDYHCDPPSTLLESLCSDIQSLQDIDFVLFTGDDPAHDIWQQSRASNMNSIRVVNDWLQACFLENPVFFAIGNHESFPVNMFAGPGYDTWLLSEFETQWTYFLSPQALETLRYGGYYTERIRPGYRVVSLNTNMFVPENLWLLVNFTDLAFQMNWLNDILNQSKTRNEHVIIIGHASCQEWYTAFCDLFSSLLQTYSSTVTELYFGHTHTTSNVLHYDAKGTPSRVAYLAGSVTMINGVNPTFRLNAYERSNGFLQGFTQYWLNLTETNIEKTKPNWLQYSYHVPDEYGMQDMTAESWYSLAIRITTNTTLYQRYAQNYNRYSGFSIPSVQELQCEMISTSAENRTRCETNN